MSMCLEQIDKVKRIGVRYINKVIIPARNVDLAQYFLCAPSAPPGLPSRVEGFLNRAEHVFEDGVKLLLTFASVDAEKDRSAFLLDLDVIWESKNPLKTADALETVNDLHEREGSAFEAVITEKTREVFEPLEPVSRGELRLEGTVASAPVSGIHAFCASGSFGAAPLLDARLPSLGASPVSFERAARTVAVIVAFEPTVTFAHDVAVAHALAPTDLEIPGGGRDVTAKCCVDDAKLAAEERSLMSITSALDEEPVEDGWTHRTQRMLASHIKAFGTSSLASHALRLEPSARAASFLRLLSRSDQIEQKLRKSLVEWGLRSTNVEVRDAAVQAAENWEGATLADLLRQHHEPVAWLADYAARVVRDLEG